MGNMNVQEWRAEAKRVRLKRYSRLGKQDLIWLISSAGQILDQSVPEIDTPLLTPTRYFLVRPRIEVNQQRRKKIREMKEMFRLRRPISETRGEWNEFVKNYKPIQFAILESASALRGFAKQFRIDSIEGFRQSEVMLRARPEVLRLMGENRKTRLMIILNCEMVRENEDLKSGSARADGSI